MDPARTRLSAPASASEASLLGSWIMSNCPWVCKSCESPVYHTKTVTPGSFSIELLLWLLFCLPGLIYSCWRIATRAQLASSATAPMRIAHMRALNCDFFIEWLIPHLSAVARLQH